MVLPEAGADPNAVYADGRLPFRHADDNEQLTRELTFIGS